MNLSSLARHADCDPHKSSELTFIEHSESNDFFASLPIAHTAIRSPSGASSALRDACEILIIPPWLLALVASSVIGEGWLRLRGEHGSTNRNRLAARQKINLNVMQPDAKRNMIHSYNLQFCCNNYNYIQTPTCSIENIN